MSKSKRLRHVSWLSHLTFHWMNSLLAIGYQRPLEREDLPEPPSHFKTRKMAKRMARLWNIEVQKAKLHKRQPQLLKVVFQFLTLKTVATVLLMKFASETLRLHTAVCLWFYLTAVTDGSRGSLYTGLVVTAFFLGLFVFTLLDNRLRYLSLVSAIRMKTALIENIHQKILNTRRYVLSHIQSGRLQNLVSTDAERIDPLIRAAMKLAIAPISIAFSIISLWTLFGYQSLTGVFVVSIELVYIMCIAGLIPKLRRKQAIITDSRLSIIREVLSSIRTVKTFAWEEKYVASVKTVRRKEIEVLLYKAMLSVINITLRVTAQAIPAFISIVAMIYSGIHLSTVEIFTLTFILGNVNHLAIAEIEQPIRVIQEARVAVQRIEQFLLNHGTPKEIGLKGFADQYHKEEEPDSAMIRLSNASAAWTKDNPNILHNINIEANNNQLVIVTGKVGSGKSSLLMLLQKEIPLTAGTLFTKGKIAYVAQMPWVFTGTIRENITFGRDYDEKKFKRVLDVCSLQVDIASFPKGDHTMIGQRGIMLSGGQRARVSLARAVYSESQIFLFDDPLCAVDSEVGKSIFDKCIRLELSGRLRVLVTHQRQYLRYADSILILDKGFLKFKGSFDALQKITLYENDTKEAFSDIDESSEDKEYNKLDIPTKDANDLDEVEEDRSNGKVTWRSYWSFLRAGWKTPTLLMFFVFQLIVQGILYSPRLLQSNMAHMSFKQQKRAKTIGTYSGLVIGAFIFCRLREFLTCMILILSSLSLHQKMVESVMKCPVLFFDTNPMGRILNRFSSDTGKLDDKLPYFMTTAMAYILEGFGITFLAVYVNAWLVLVLIPLSIVFLYYCLYYLQNSREICRLQAISCSPVYEQLEETLRGLEVIRSLQMESHFAAKMIRALDHYNQVSYIEVSLGLWLAVRISIIFTLFAVGVASFGPTIIEDTGLTGMLLTTNISVIGMVITGLQSAAEVENIMTSAERVLAYCSLPSEPGYHRRSQPPENWPNHGKVSLNDVSLLYVDNGVKILENFSLEVQPLEKVGIVGRTGAGKSSLFAAILRLPEPQGQVVIDGVDLGSINIQAARKSMAVISQDPILFSGTLKKHLDPFDLYTDDEIWTALKQVQLSDKIAKLPDQLEVLVGERGRGFSVGERQLLCLARALLQRCRILLMDEATANVDFETDQLIQETIRNKFGDCTVLTIAHRADTIMDYDRVVVMDQGRVIEEGQPSHLAYIRNSGFFKSIIRPKEDLF